MFFLKTLDVNFFHDKKTELRHQFGRSGTRVFFKVSRFLPRLLNRPQAAKSSPGGRYFSTFGSLARLLNLDLAEGVFQ